MSTAFQDNLEFIAVPQSLSTSGGEPLACNDKWKVLHNIEEVGAVHVWEVDRNCLAEMDVLIVDGMAALNQIHKDRDTKTCKVSFADTYKA